MSEPGRTGGVFLRDFDEGVVETLGAKLSVRRLADGKSQPNYFLPTSRFTATMSFKGVSGQDGEVLVTFADPEDAYEVTEVPQVLVRRGDHVAAPLRYNPKTLEYRIASSGAQELVDGQGRVGYSRYESKPWAYPYDIPYDITLFGRTRGDAEKMLKHAMRVYKHPASSVYVRDSLGERRTYEAFQEGFASTGELAKVGERVVSWTLSIRVEGELDLDDPSVSVAATQGAVVNAGLR